MTTEEFDQMNDRLNRAACFRGEIGRLEDFLARNDWQLDQFATLRTQVRDVSQFGGSQETVMQLPMKDLIPMLRDYAEKRLAAAIVELEKL